MTTLQVPAAIHDQAESRPRQSVALAIVVPAATMFAVLAVALLLLLTPFWMHWAIDASGGTQAAPQPEQAYALSDRTVAELLVGPGTFSDYSPDEAAHMRDVRVVLYGFLGLTALGAGLVGWWLFRSRDAAQAWRLVAHGGAGLVIVISVLGILALLAFGPAFELFHRLLFPGGNWSFPETSRLIQLYPIGFWQLTAAAMGVLSLGGGLAVWILARRRALALERR